jgi:hypothetical protein
MLHCLLVRATSSPIFLESRMINFTNFTGANNLTLNGNAAVSGDLLRLTPGQESQRGSVFYDTAYSLSGSTSFQTKFQLQLRGGQGIDGADGITFLLQNSSAGKQALGGLGGGLGYGGIDRSIAIEFDTYDNGDSDIDNNHISVLRNGNINNALSVKTAGLDLNGGGVLTAWVEYVASAKQLSVFISNNGSKPGTALLTTNVDLADTLGNQFYVGFTGGTGGRFNNQEILNWEFGTDAGSIVPPPPVPPATPGSGTGLQAEYYDTINFTGPAVSRIDETVNFDWGGGLPTGVGLSSPDSFSVRWTGQVEAQYDEVYTFYTRTDDGVKLWVNDQLIVDAYRDQAATEARGSITLRKGVKYNIKMEYYENAGEAVSQLSWSSTSQAKQIIPKSQLFNNYTPPLPPTAPGDGTGLKAEYFDNQNFTNLRFTRTDANVNFNWFTEAPDAGMGRDTFSVRWTGDVEAQYTEAYTFYTTTDDGVRLWVNDQLIVDAYRDQAATEARGTINLEAGKKYSIRLDYYENAGDAVSRLSWSSRSQAKQIIPTSQLYSNTASPPPPPGSGAGDGLTAQYFDNINFTNSKLTRIDETVNFSWGGGKPASEIGADTFSVRWTGQIQAQYDETYTFFTSTDDGVKLWVNDKLIVNAYRDQAETEARGTIALEAGKKYSIRMEYYENAGEAAAKLSWSSRSQAKQIIPKSQLFSDAKIAATTTVEAQSRFNLSNFSHNPIVTLIDPPEDQIFFAADTDFIILAEGEPGSGAIQSDNFADAFGKVEPNPAWTNAQVDSRAKVVGRGVGYEGIGTAQAGVEVYNFFITGDSDGDLTNDLFSFDLSTFMTLTAQSRDIPPAIAVAEGLTELVLYAGETAEDVTTELGIFRLQGSADIQTTFPGFTIDNQLPGLQLSTPTGSTRFTASSFFANTAMTGKFQQSFTNATYLRLVQQQANQAYTKQESQPPTV